jgi:RNA polymerase subunit RPABC4/transcription elongation factor Spt4
MDVVRNLKVNLKLAGKACRSCQVPLQLAEDAVLCNGCQGEHHNRCWDGLGGCASAGCVNAPLRQLDAAIAPALAPGLTRCPHCSSVISAGDALCPICRGITSPDGIYHGPRVNAPGAVASMVYGLVGLFLFGMILGPVAIAKSNAAKREIAGNPTYGGGGYATAGLVLGILDIAAFVLFLIARVGS